MENWDWRGDACYIPVQENQNYSKIIYMKRNRGVVWNSNGCRARSRSYIVGR